MQEKNVIELKKSVNPKLIEDLEAILESARKGELLGVTAMLLHPGREYGYISIGDMEFSETLLAFEDFKWHQMAMRHLGDGQ